MPSDLVSGPDLGGGFLHQLSVDRDGSTTTFTHHAQDGGSDAGGPPKGPLGPFGFVHPETPCMFGGPRCWHRRFLLPYADVPRVRQAYTRHRFVLETLMEQAYGGAPVPLETGLAETLDRVADPLADLGVDWYVGGSTAAWLLGGAIVPRDIDLGADRAGVDQLARLLGDYLIEPLAPTDWPHGRIVRGARAFVGSLRDGVRVEWAVPLDREPAPLDEWDLRAGGPRLVTAQFRGRSLRVTRPEYALVRTAAAGRSDRAPALTDLVRRLGADRDLLDTLLARTSLEGAAREAIRRAVLD